MIGVFARADHPEGYGTGKTAHGYVVVLVKCHYADQLNRVQRVLATAGLPEPFGHPYPWYGGRMDLVAVIAGSDAAAELEGGFDNRRKSIGDNRFCGIYDASELLGPPGGSG